MESEVKKKKKIFIIEDDANILFGLQAKLRIAGFDVVINNGTDEIERIIEELRISNPDYIVLNLLLPKIDGATLLKVLKSDETLNKSCVFTFSHLSEDESKKWTTLLGSDYYFIKHDFVIDNFVEKIIKIIENRGKLESY